MIYNNIGIKYDIKGKIYTKYKLFKTNGKLIKLINKIPKNKTIYNLILIKIKIKVSN